jgi:7,8-dihydropterin-6-yl-methyl-4-(beta-D-ribofuranosyl)aminobenzene 5'-phosphate synthase
MDGIAGFGATHDVTITILVDNRADLLVKSTHMVKYFTDAPLLAEHGFAALVTLKSAGVRILWDAGMTALALPENMKRMKIAPSKITMLALSHGHGDHTGAVADVLRAIALPVQPRRWPAGTPLADAVASSASRRTPLVVHPAAFREHWWKNRDGSLFGPVPGPARAVWEAAGADIILAANPFRLAPGCWTTGAIPRRSFEKSGIGDQLFYRDGDTLYPDKVEDDQAIVINIAGKGLVVLSGCAHSGIINTVRYAQEISGIDRVYAVIGGFHLAPATAEELALTVAGIKQLRPMLIAPTHCTGFPAISRFAAQMPDAYVQCVAGATFLF